MTPINLIDQLVEETTDGTSEKLIRESGIYSKATGENRANEFVRSLTPEQQLLVAKMLRSERVGAIHGVLSNLTWWMSCRDVGLTFQGEPMPVGASEGIHGD